MRNTVFLAGHALLPQQAAAQKVYDDLVITVEIDPKYAVIVSVGCNLITDLARQFLINLLVARSLMDGVDGLVKEVQTLYQGAAQNAIVAALKDLQRRFELWRQSARGGKAGVS